MGFLESPVDITKPTTQEKPLETQHEGNPLQQECLNAQVSSCTMLFRNPSDLNVTHKIHMF